MWGRVVSAYKEVEALRRDVPCLPEVKSCVNRDVELVLLYLELRTLQLLLKL